MTSGTGRPWVAARSIGSVQTRTEDRFAAATGLAATLVVGIAGLVGVVTGGPGAELPGRWWLAYGLFLAAFVADSDLVARGAAPAPRSDPFWRRSEVLSLVEVGAALLVWFADPGAGWSAVLFVVSAVSVAFVHPRSVTVAVIAVQTLAVAVGSAMLGQPSADVVLSTVLYAAFQSFAFNCSVETDPLIQPSIEAFSCARRCDTARWALAGMPGP